MARKKGEMSRDHVITLINPMSLHIESLPTLPGVGYIVVSGILPTLTNRYSRKHCGRSDLVMHRDCAGVKLVSDIYRSN